MHKVERHGENLYAKLVTKQQGRTFVHHMPLGQVWALPLENNEQTLFVMVEAIDNSGNDLLYIILN